MVCAYLYLEDNKEQFAKFKQFIEEQKEEKEEFVIIIEMFTPTEEENDNQSV